MHEAKEAWLGDGGGGIGTCMAAEGMAFRKKTASAPPASVLETKRDVCETEMLMNSIDSPMRMEA